MILIDSLHLGTLCVKLKRETDGTFLLFINRKSETKYGMLLLYLYFELCHYIIQILLSGLFSATPVPEPNLSKIATLGLSLAVNISKVGEHSGSQFKLWNVCSSIHRWKAIVLSIAVLIVCESMQARNSISQVFEHGGVIPKHPACQCSLLRGSECLPRIVFIIGRKESDIVLFQCLNVYHCCPEMILTLTVALRVKTYNTVQNKTSGA